MAEIKDLRDGTEFTGQRVESIVRRVWGRTATLKPTQVTDRYRVVKPDRAQPGAFHVLAVILVRSW